MIPAPKIENLYERCQAYNNWLLEGNKKEMYEYKLLFSGILIFPEVNCLFKCVLQFKMLIKVISLSYNVVLKISKKFIIFNSFFYN